MSPLSYILLFVIGASLGSFLGVCAYRIPRGLSIVKPRSYCPGCNSQLVWYDLIPVLSFFVLTGRCRWCSTKIPKLELSIEIFSGLLLIVTFRQCGPTVQFFLISFFVLLMLLIAIIDWKHLIIPNALVITGIILGIILKGFVEGKFVDAAISTLIALAVMAGIRFLGNALFKKETMGMGDVKLSAVLGVFLGWQLFLATLWIASIIGSIYGLARSGRGTKVSFGSFLAVVAIAVILFQNDLLFYFAQWLN